MDLPAPLTLHALDYAVIVIYLAALTVIGIRHSGRQAGLGDYFLAGRSIGWVVLGLFAIIVWLARRVGPKGNAALPEKVVETLGRAPLSGRQQMHLVRVGNKLLLLAVTPTSAETLTEITDPAEIDRLAGICQQNQPGSITASFREVFSQLGHQPSTNDR